MLKRCCRKLAVARARMRFRETRFRTAEARLPDSFTVALASFTLRALASRAIRIALCSAVNFRLGLVAIRRRSGQRLLNSASAIDSRSEKVLPRGYMPAPTVDPDKQGQAQELFDAFWLGVVDWASARQEAVDAFWHNCLVGWWDAILRNLLSPQNIPPAMLVVLIEELDNLTAAWSAARALGVLTAISNIIVKNIDPELKQSIVTRDDAIRMSVRAVAQATASAINDTIPASVHAALVAKKLGNFRRLLGLLRQLKIRAVVVDRIVSALINFSLAILQMTLGVVAGFILYRFGLMLLRKDERDRIFEKRSQDHPRKREKGSILRRL